MTGAVVSWLCALWFGECLKLTPLCNFFTGTLVTPQTLVAPRLHFPNQMNVLYSNRSFNSPQAISSLFSIEGFSIL